MVTERFASVQFGSLPPPPVLAKIGYFYVRREAPLIGLYREKAIAIESEARDPFGGNMYYVTMQITLFIPEFARVRNVICIVT